MNNMVLVSGGVNSAVLLGLAREEGTCSALHVSFGQRTAQKEAECFEAICDHYQVQQRKKVELPFFAEIGGNARVDKQMEIEDALAIGENVPSTFVPALIPTMLDLAHAWASRLNAHRIFVGTSENLGPPGPPTEQMYPDYRREFYHLYNYLLSQCARPRFELKVVMPLLEMSRADVVRLAQRVAAPLEHTWSCYRSGTRPCGSCYRCAVRARGFLEAGLPDPLMALAPA
jgi:7-cyano-7-deazaguanine synthase